MTEKILPNVEMADILQWPGTPGVRRWMSVAAHLKWIPENPDSPEPTAQTYRDAGMALRIRKIPEFEDWAMSEFAERGGDGNPVAFPIIKEITLRGSNEWMIGIAVIRDTVSPSENSVTLIVSQLPRDASWTGINRILPEIKSLDCFIIKDEYPPPEDPHRILQVLAASPRFLDRELFPDLKEQPGFPEGPPEEMRKILEWHGALSCTWMTIEPG